MSTPKSSFQRLAAFSSYADHLPINEIPDAIGLAMLPELRRTLKANRPNPTQNSYLEPTKVLVTMVGLPARGKSYTATKIQSYFRWLGINSQIFNVGVYRRQVLSPSIDQSAKFFEASNLPARKLREQLAVEVLDQLFDWLDSGGQIAIFDATNTTNARRREIIRKCHERSPGTQMIFIENICDDAYVLAENFKQKVLISPDYQSVSVEGASSDLTRRIINYEKVYETITDENLTYIKIINVKSRVICNRIIGTIPKMITDYVMKLHVLNRSIWFTRPGISDSKSTTFTDHDAKYAQKLLEFLQKRLGARTSSLVIFTGTSTRLLKMGAYITNATVIPTATLNPIDMGMCEKMNMEQIETELPSVYKGLQEDRFNYRIPEGESFADLIQRLRPLVLELEQLTMPILIISHAAPIQGLYTYFKELDVETAPYFHVPKQSIIELTSNRYGWKEKHYSIL